MPNESKSINVNVAVNEQNNRLLMASAKKMDVQSYAKQKQGWRII
ncbi:protein of unknown function [Vibrio tapetis subsp. tapetis]|uniref:Uncharacterized protein n=1 Tax=Vibrio tapetis subsp. tapetis TaxID=1671868 RepID=A0A2N8ZI70_9VIBR|nr:hypothetical protein [Vibrio tapetis]SON51581.1 protein of unknown function [Vibrio tapetis subsp. tapetis]